MVPFPLVVMLVFALYLKRSFMSMKSFCSLQEVYGKQLVFSSKVFTCFLCGPFSPLMGRFFDHSFHQCLLLRGTGGYSCVAKTLKTLDSKYCFKRHHRCHVPTTPPPLDLVPPPIFYYHPKHIFVWIGFCLPKPLPLLPIYLWVGFLGWYMNIS
jgi:hypothetical protein